SLILTHDPDGEICGLNEFEGAHPPVFPVFWSFRVMVGVGVLMLAVAWLAAFQLRRRGSLPKLTLRILVGMTFSGWVALLSGWYVTEIGRQPWLVHGVLKTADAASDVPGGMILSSLVMYLALYVVLLIAYVSVLFHLARKAGDGGDGSPTGKLSGEVAK